MIYLIEESSGTYDSYSTVIVGAYKTKERAEEELRKLEAKAAEAFYAQVDWNEAARKQFLDVQKNHVAYRAWYHENPRPSYNDEDYEIIEMELQE